MSKSEAVPKIRSLSESDQRPDRPPSTSCLWQEFSSSKDEIEFSDLELFSSSSLKLLSTSLTSLNVLLKPFILLKPLMQDLEINALRLFFLIGFVGSLLELLIEALISVNLFSIFLSNFSLMVFQQSVLNPSALDEASMCCFSCARNRIVSSSSSKTFF